MSRGRRDWPAKRPKCLHCGKPLRPTYAYDHPTKEVRRCATEIGTSTLKRLCGILSDQHKILTDHVFTPGEESTVALPSKRLHKVLFFGHVDTFNLFCTLRHGVEWAAAQLRNEIVARRMDLDMVNRSGAELEAFWRSK